MITKLLASRKSAHWYKKDATPVFEVAAKKGGYKKTTVTEAREMDLVPSVTTVLRVLDKPNLDIWRISQAIKASIAMKREAGEKIHQFINRIVDRAEQKSTKAVKFGKDTHSQIENYINKTGDIEPYISELLKPFHSFVSEESLANDLVAGTIDISCMYDKNIKCLIDTKTQSTKAGKKFNLYDEHKLQLAAYSILKPADRFFILFVSSTEKDRAELIEIPAKEIEIAKDIFITLVNVFMWSNRLGKYKIS